MIKFATDKDKNRIIDLWVSAFGDSRQNVERFLDFFPCEKALGYYADGQLVSFMFLLDLELVLNGKAYKTNYIYALTTDEAFRSHGFGGKLVEFSKDYSAKNNIPYTLIRPSTDTLFDYYYAKGFEREYFRVKKNLTIDSKMLYNNLDKDSVAFARWGRDGTDYSVACGIDDGGYLPVGDCENAERYLMLRRNFDGIRLFDSAYMGLTFE